MVQRQLQVTAHVRKYVTALVQPKNLSKVDISGLQFFFGEESIRCVRILAKSQVLYCTIHAIPCHIWRFGSCQ